MLTWSSHVISQCPNSVGIVENSIVFIYFPVPDTIPESFTFQDEDFSISQFGNTSLFLADPNEINITNTPDLNQIEVSEISFGINYPDQSINCLYNNGSNVESILPVDFSRFEAYLDGQNIFVEWTTLREEYNAGFEIQQSYDGNNFITIGSIEGLGFSEVTQDYSYTDKGIRVRALGEFSYYRLVQIDYDGTKTYSETSVVDLELEFEKFEITKITGWNSRTKDLKIYYYAPESTRKVNFLLSDLNGRIITKASTFPEKGLNVLEFDLNKEYGNIYILSLDNGKEIIGEKIILGHNFR